MSRAIAATVVVLAAACAGPNSHVARLVRVVDHTDRDGLVVGTVETVYAEDSLNCAVETPTGTHIAKRICRFEVESAFLRQRTQDMMHALRGSASTSEHGGGGAAGSYRASH